MFLKIIIILQRFNWIPIPYNKSSLLPENMPHALQEAVQFSNKV